MKTLVNVLRNKAQTIVSEIKEASMKHSQSFVVSTLVDQKMWTVKPIWKQAEKAEVIELSVDYLLARPGNLAQGSAERVMAADLSYPILIDSASGMLIDGRHRLAKSKALGLDTVKAKVITLKEPDVVIVVGRTVVHNKGHVLESLKDLAVNMPKEIFSIVKGNLL